jgi:hypothetical protein
VASEAVSSSDAMNTVVYIAWVTPMSRTRPAFSSKLWISRSGCPKSRTSSAPATLKRSVIIDVMRALRL